MEEALRRYFEWARAESERRGIGLPKIPFDEDVSPFIYVGEPDREGWICWQPLPKTVRHDLGLLENELGVTFPRSLHGYFNSYWFCDLGGGCAGFGMDLFPVPPGKEMNRFVRALIGYRYAHGNTLAHVPIGMETNGLLVVLERETGCVRLEDYERGSFTTIAPSLEELVDVFWRGSGPKP